MIVDHVCSADQFALALQNIGELYPVHQQLARNRAKLADWAHHVRGRGVREYRKSVGVAFAITDVDADRAAEILRDYYEQHAKETAQ